MSHPAINLALSKSNLARQAIDIAFLFFVLLYALTGVYVVLTDMEGFNRGKRILAAAAIVIGIGAFIYGVQTILAFDTWITANS